MKKKLFTFLLAIAASIGTMLANGTKIGDFYYNLNASNKTAEVTYQYEFSPWSSLSNYLGLTKADIPASVEYQGETYGVTSIGVEAFYGCSSLTSVTIPNSVTSIGSGAFSSCTRLKKVNISDLSAWCNIVFSYSLSNPLYYAKHLFLNDVETLDLVIPDNVTSIGDYAFYGCSDLTSVSIPESVTSIGSNAFYYVPNIKYSGTAIGSPWGARTINGYVDGFVVYSNADKTILSACSTAASGDIVIPNSVISIGSNAFDGCSNLTSVTIPNSITSIGDNVFYGCSGLTSVNIPEGVTSIGQGAFYNCSGLTSVNIPEGVTSIGQGAFYNCSGLTSVTIPNNVTNIGSDAFRNCLSLIWVTIGNSVTSIGNYAFDNCNSLTKVNISDLTTWCNINFSSYSGTNPLYCAKHLFLNDEEITDLVVPNSVTSVGSYTFCNCIGLTSVIIPESVKSIEDGAFKYCKNIISVTIPNSVTSIGEYAFYGCSSLTSVTIPSSVTNIGNYAFTDVPNIVYSGTATGSPWGAKNVNGFVDGWLVYKDASKTQLLACSAEATGELVIPNSVTSIGDGAFYGCSGLTSVTISSGVTSIGKRTFSGCINLTSVAIPNSVKSIGKQAFYNCSSLTSIILPNNLINIEEMAFYDCSGLTSITIPESVESVGEFAFGGCKSLPVIDHIRYADKYLIEAVDKYKSTYAIKDGTKWIGGEAFYGCYNLRSIKLPRSLKVIEDKAFVSCTELDSIEIPENVTNVGEETFAGCNSLKYVMWNARACGDYDYLNPFSSNYGGETGIVSCSWRIETFVLGDSVQHIPAGLCEGMDKIKEIVIPQNVKSIGASVFNGCGVTSIVWKAKKCSDFTYKSTPFMRTDGYYNYQNYDIRNKITSFIIDDEVEYIPAYLCYGLQNVPEIVVPNCHTQIGYNAFYECKYRINGTYDITYPDTTLCYGQDLYIDGVLCDLAMVANSRKTWTRYLTTTEGCDSIIRISVMWRKFPDAINITKTDEYDNLNTGKITISAVNGQYDYYTLNGYRNASLYNLSAGDYRLVFYGIVCEDSIVKSIQINKYGMRVNGMYYLLNEENHTAMLTYRGTSYSDYSSEYSGNITIPKSITFDGVEYQVTGINNSTFSGCSNIKSITLESEIPITMPYNSGLSNSCVIYVPYGSLSAYKSSSNWSDYNIHVIDPTHAVATCGATSASIVVGNEDEQKHIVSCGINGAEEFDGNVIEYCGLEPETTCSNVSFKVKTIEGDIDEVICSFTTTALELNTQPARLTSESSAVLVAYTNMADIETSCGFEFRRTGASDLVPSQMMNCAIANGTMAVKVNNIKAGVEYKYRPYYTSKQGNTKYGDWTAFDPIDAYIEYEPIVCTQTATGVTNSKATMRAMVVEGSSAISEQGFDVCAVGRQINNAQGAPRRAHKSVIGEHWTVPAEDTNMKVTLTDLDEGTTYTYRTYVIINGDTIFGSEQSFTTLGEYLYTVTFVDYDGTILGTDKVHYGDAATAPEDPIREGYEFTGWDNDFSNVTDDLTITATYSIATALPESTATQSKAQKLLHDGQLFIVLPDGTRYTATGMKVE